MVIVPKSIDDDSLIAASKFREGGRFPVLSYKHEGGVSITIKEKCILLYY
jgi:myotubularin-related protein 9